MDNGGSLMKFTIYTESKPSSWGLTTRASYGKLGPSFELLTARLGLVSLGRVPSWASRVAVGKFTLAHASDGVSRYIRCRAADGGLRHSREV